MSRIRYRYRVEEPSTSGIVYFTVGAVAGLTAGVFLAQRLGGLDGVTARVRERFGGLRVGGGETRRFDDLDEYETEEEYGAVEGIESGLEERVLEAFHNDPILSERAIDIGAIGEGIIELTGWVHSDDESQHAVTLTRGVPGVETVVNRLAVREEEERFDEAARRLAEGDDRLTEARWEGQGVGTGRRRQGTSAEVDRHADPRAELEDRWQSKEQAVRAAADDIEGIAERRQRAKKQPPAGDRTGGSPVAPSGVPKGDHVADPAEAQELLRGETGRTPTPINPESPRAD